MIIATTIPAAMFFLLVFEIPGLAFANTAHITMIKNGMSNHTRASVSILIDRKTFKLGISRKERYKQNEPNYF